VEKTKKSEMADPRWPPPSLRNYKLKARPSLETQGEIVGRGKVGTGQKKVGEEKSMAKRFCP